MGNTAVKMTHRGAITFTAEKLHPGILSFGADVLNYSAPHPIFIRIEGQLIIHGTGHHDISPGVSIGIRKTGILEIGNDFYVGAFSKFIIGAHSKIGNNNMHSWQNIYMDTDSHPIYTNDELINPPKGIEIGNRVWIGAQCTILKGVKISDGCIVGTGSFLTKSLTDKESIYASNRKLKENVKWSYRLI